MFLIKQAFKFVQCVQNKYSTLPWLNADGAEPGIHGFQFQLIVDRFHVPLWAFPPKKSFPVSQGKQKLL